MMTNNLSLNNFIATFLLVVTIVFAFSSFYVPSAQAVDGFEDTIFFEYGAEQGLLEPSWDVVGPHGGAVSSPPKGSATIDATHVRTGDYAVKLWQDDPPKLEGDRRVVLRKYIGTTEKDVYWSYWAYFPSIDGWKDLDWGDDGFHLGGIRWAVYDDDGNWVFSGIKFAVSSGRTFYFSYRNYLDNDYFTQQFSSHQVNEFFGQWVHLQGHIKFTSDNTGVVQGWFNNELVLNLSGLKTDPESFDNFEGFAGSSNGYILIACLYGSKSNPTAWHWVDDLVMARERVPETYKVKGK